MTQAAGDQPRDGAVGMKAEDGSMRFANPHSIWFSTYTMMATHVYKNGEWEPIWKEEDDLDT